MITTILLRLIVKVIAAQLFCYTKPKNHTVSKAQIFDEISQSNLGSNPSFCPLNNLGFLFSQVAKIDTELWR